MNKMAVVIAIVLITITILVIIYTWLFARFYCKPKKLKTRKTPLDYGLPAKLVEFKSQGKILEGWFIGKNLYSESNKIVILTHGWSTNLSILLPLAKFLFNAGLNLFLYNCRGHGSNANDGPITLKKMAQDICAAIDYVYQQHKSENLQIDVIGHCMGASAAIVAASNDPRINKIIACSSFSDPKTLTTRYVRQNKIPMGILIHIVFYFIERWLGTTISNVTPLNRIQHIDKEILLVHGTRDKVVPYSDSVSLYDTSPSNRIDLLKIEKRGHFDILRDSTFMNFAVAFINDKNVSANCCNKIELSGHNR